MNTIKLNVIGELTSSAKGGGGGGSNPSEPSKKQWTGHADVDGLRAIGWTDEDIAYYQANGVNWNEEDDKYHKVTDDNKALYGVLTVSNISTYKNRIVYLPQIDTSSVTNMNSMFRGCYSLVSIPQIDTSSVTSMSYMFSSCYSLVSIPQIDTSSVTSMNYMFNNCYSLVYVYLKNIKKDCTINNSTILSKESLLYIINNLYDLTVNGLSGQTLIIGSTNIAKLTADEIAIGTNKGWTIK
jgi:surface protein